MVEIGFAKSNFLFEGPALGNNCTIEFAGLVPLASKMVIKAIRSLKLDDGEYRKFSVKDPSNVETAIFIDPDKNGRTQKT